MYYLEIRFNESNSVKSVSALKQAELNMEIISCYTSTYYICYRIIHPLSKAVYDKIKNNPLFYFVCYYKI